MIWLGRYLAAELCNGSCATDIFKYSEMKDNLYDAVYWHRRHEEYVEAKGVSL